MAIMAIVNQAAMDAHTTHHLTISQSPHTSSRNLMKMQRYRVLHYVYARKGGQTSPQRGKRPGEPVMLQHKETCCTARNPAARTVRCLEAKTKVTRRGHEPQPGRCHHRHGGTAWGFPPQLTHGKHLPSPVKWLSHKRVPLPSPSTEWTISTFPRFL